jgi:2-polyprenyl-3-methyl-5-hydroxy-6-metoxy-1,4-benzoquinol methylase
LLTHWFFLSTDFLKTATIMAVFDRNPTISANCPICDFPLAKKGPTIFIKDIFEDWSPHHRFSEQTIQEHLQQSQTSGLYECPNCLLEIFLPAVIGTERFYQELQEDVRFAYYRKDKWDFSIALKDVKGCNNIIEIGCGPGNFLNCAKPRSRRVCGTETNQAALQLARSKGLEVYGPDKEHEVPKASFDAVFSFHVLEHVAEPMEFFKTLRSLMKPEGKICISMPDQDGPLRHLENEVMNMPPHHATHWRLRTLKAAAAKLDLKISKVAYEPLLLESHCYYSYYWLNKAFADKKYLQRKMKGFISILMRIFFGILMRIGLKHFVLLRGQTIYVVMKKK